MYHGDHGYAGTGPGKMGGGHHILAYNSLLSAVAGYQLLAAVPDPVVPQDNLGQQYRIPGDWRIAAAFAGGAACLRARVSSPSLSLRGNLGIAPFETTQQAPQNPNFMDLTAAPCWIRRDEPLRVDMESNSATNALVALWVYDQLDHDYVINPGGPPQGGMNGPNDPAVTGPDLRWVRATVNITTVANLWAGPGTIIFDENLEGGQYAVYGMQAFFATALLARLIFPGQVKRPGCLGQGAAARRSAQVFHGGLGLWGKFDTFALPQLEVMDSASAAVTYTIWLLMAKVGPAFSRRPGQEEML